MDEVKVALLRSLRSLYPASLTFLSESDDGVALRTGVPGVQWLILEWKVYLVRIHS